MFKFRSVGISRRKVEMGGKGRNAFPKLMLANKCQIEGKDQELAMSLKNQ